MLDGAPGRYAWPYDSDAIRIGKDAADHGMLGPRDARRLSFWSAMTMPPLQLGHWEPRWPAFC
jgi:hypothetical protein